VSNPLEFDAQEETSGAHTSENDEKEEEPHSPTMDAGSNSSTSSSTPVKMRRLSDIYARCNFCVVEPKSFEQAVQEEV
jgi:FtsZ-interacting cell division protein YlmF